MNNKQKIIISVTGMFLVLLLLVGLTYGYFLTKISGNNNDKSISVTTANLALVYGDGNGELVSDGTIIPGTTVSSKTFTVTNEGNATTDYAVVLENYKIAYAMTSGEQVGGATTTLAYPDDFKLKITCTSSKDGKTCNGLDDTLPTTNDILLTNSIEIGETQSYELSLEYIETGTDQSNDMNKTIEGKINIIDTKSTVDIEGILTSYSTGDYVQVNSTPKVSQITSEGKYKVIGVEPGSHTIEIYSKTGTKKGTQSIEIVKGTSESVSGNTITVTDNSRTATIDITNDYNITIDKNIKGINPYIGNKTTLAYNIINNAITSKNGTTLTNLPVTTPAKGAGNMIYTGYTNPTSFESTTGYTSKWYVYGSKITIDKDGWFKITNPQVGQFSSVATSMINGYISNYWGYDDEATARENINNEFSTIYKVGSETTTSKLYYKVVTKTSENTESVLSITTDDYGTSYYYRGGVEDNYVNFAGMCWRVVRIEGDGSTKLILEDQSTTCNSEIYTGNWSLKTGHYGCESTSTSGSLLYKINYLNPVTEKTFSMVKSFYDFQTTNLASYTDKLKPGDWCLGDTAYSRIGSSKSDYTYTLLSDTSSNYLSKTSFYYDAYARLTGNNKDGYTPSLKCNGTKLDKFVTVINVSEEAPMYVSAITADEVAYAGGKYGSSNQNYYLINEEFKKGSSGMIGSYYFWTLSPFEFYNNYDLAFKVDNYGYLEYDNVNNYSAFRPAVTLTSSTQITSGDGTKNNPYEIG